MGWKFFARTLHGDGTETALLPHLDLRQVSITTVLSGTNSLTATVPVEDARLLDANGELLLREWSTTIYAELDGTIRGGGILKNITEGPAELGLECVGFVGYLAGMPWESQGLSFIQTDPFDIAHAFWRNVQSVRGSDLGLRLDFEPDDSPLKLGWVPPEKWRKIYVPSPTPTVTSLREGEPIRVFSPPVYKTEDGKRETVKEEELQYYGYGTRRWVPLSRQNNKPYLLLNTITNRLVIGGGSGDEPPENTRPLARLLFRGEPTNQFGLAMEPYGFHAWDTPECASRWDDLAKDGRFDYVETHRWGGEQIRHTLQVGYPTIGSRRDTGGSNGLLFKVGLNVAAAPEVTTSGDEYADKVIVVGAGEGAAQISESYQGPRVGGRLHRTKLVTNQAIRNKYTAQSYAQRLQRGFGGGGSIDQITVRNHPNAPLGSYQVGDTITVYGDGKGWAGDMKMTVRITQITLSPDAGDDAQLTVVRTDRVDA